MTIATSELAARGTVTINLGCLHQCVTPLLDVSGSRCRIFINKDELYRPAQRERVQEACSTPNISYVIMSALATSTEMRVLKDAGVENRSCSSCEVDETVFGRSLKKCAGCNYAFYCSRACQKVHFWSEHQQQCKEFQIRSRFMSGRGYIACAHCHSIEVQKPQHDQHPQLFCGDLGDQELFNFNATCRMEYMDQHIG